MKTCSKCKEERELLRFSRSSKAVDGYQPWCKDCAKAAKTTWLKTSQDKVRWNNLWSTYRLRREDYERLLADQGNRCAVCSEPFTATPHIDHDHQCCSGERSCGKCVRGLTCQSCNHMVGWYEKMHNSLDPVTQRVVRYLDTKLP